MRTQPARRRSEHGQALAEFSLVAPILLLLVFGIVDMARLYQAWVTVQGAARDGARYGVTGRSDCASSMSDRYACIQETAARQAGALAGHKDGVTVSAGSWKFPGYTTQNPAGDPGAQCDMLEVKVEYDYSPSTPLIDRIIGPVHLVARERMVNEPFGPCASS